MFIRESLERYILIERDIFYRHYWELQSQRYNALMDTQNEMRHLRHDMRHHFQVLAGMATVEDATKAPARLKAIQDYLKDSHTTVGNAPMVLSRNPIINTLIPYYLDIAKAANLDFTYHIDIPVAGDGGCRSPGARSGGMRALRRLYARRSGGERHGRSATAATNDPQSPGKRHRWRQDLRPSPPSDYLKYSHPPKPVNHHPGQ